MPKDILYPLRCLHGQLHEKRLESEREFQKRKMLKRSTRDTIFLLGTPVHPNIGDSAIAMAELFFLRRILPSNVQIMEVMEDVFRNHRALVDQRIRMTGDLPILWHGGGNMGDLWVEQELMRREALEAYSGRRIISFPQTIYFSDTEKGRSLSEASIPFYNGRTGLTLTAREKRSFEIMKTLYPDTDMYLMPDIVLSSSAEEFGVKPQPRQGVLMCLRGDVEKSIPDSFWDALKQRIDQQGLHWQVTDMGYDRLIDQNNRAAVVRDKMQEFRGAELAITDRLHGMVFAALCGTPCIAFGNYNHKVRSTYDWIQYLPYIRYAETMEEAEHLLPELLSMKNCRYDSAPLSPYYEKLKELILEACR